MDFADIPKKAPEPIGYPLPDPPSPSLKRGAGKPEDFTRWNGS
jgi:hypothetical protein